MKMIDNTLANLDSAHLPPREMLVDFCNMLNQIGVEMIEISVPVFEKIGYLPEEGKYILHLNHILEKAKYEKKGFYKFVCRHADNSDDIISEFQINDIREIVQLRAHKDLKYVRLVGFDDLITKNFIYEMNEIKNIFKNSDINFCPENSYCSATALAVQWVMNGGKEVTTGFCGHNNKAATEEVILALRLHKRYKPNRDLSLFTEMTSLYEDMIGKKIYNQKPVIGKNIFMVESGIHVDGIQKNKANYEAYDPKIVGRDTQIILGKHSGTKAIQMKMVENRIPFYKTKMVYKILKEVQDEAVRNGRSLANEEFIKIADKVIANEGKKMDSGYNIT